MPANVGLINRNKILFCKYFFICFLFFFFAKFGGTINYFTMSEESNLNLTPINDLLGKKFFIPSYQRGYRWEERQVRDLLNDVWEFIQKGNKSNEEFYCLQPIVVKTKDSKYRVIDGQQRLTTIFLILKHLEKFVESENKNFKIEYQTRKTSKDFLENIQDKTENESNENIDFHHIYKAYSVIQDWFKEKANKGFSSVSSKFITPFLENVKIIWYELPETENEIDAFTRLNMGKIPLTSAELIKSLFLNSQNFKENEKEIKQIELAKEWDEMEQTLQDDAFWCFLTTKEPYPARIELIFEIFSGENNTKNDNLIVYIWFQKQKDAIKEDKKSITKLWSEDKDNIKKVFLTLKHWFEDRTLYHLIGFLIAIDEKDVKVQTIYNESKEKTKTEFKNYLYKQIEKQIGDINEIENLEYGKDHSKITKTLLFFNIATLLNEESSHLRFAFDKYRQKNKYDKKKWTLEHIHPQSEAPIPERQQEEWLEQAKKAIQIISDKENSNEEILKEIREFSDEKNQNDFDELKREILKLFGDESSDGIENLTLLKREDNSSLSNHLFPTKREKIISKDKNGSFIPICTKNVFLKYYSSNIQNLYFWSENDRNDYLKAIKETLNKFLKGNK